MKYLHIYIGFFIFFCEIVFSQNTDRLKLQYQKTSDPDKKVALLIKTGHLFEKRDLDSALFYYKKALTFEKKITDTLLARVYSNIGNANLLKGNIDVCLEYQLKALKFYELYPPQQDIVRVYNSIALVYFFQGDFDKALVRFNQVKSLLDQNIIKDSIKVNLIKGKILNNIGIIYDNQHKEDLALEYFMQASTHSKKAKDNENLSSVYSNMGIIYLKGKRYDLAEAIFIEALNLRKKENNIFGLCKSNYHLGRLYKEKKQFDKATEYLLTSLKYCRQANSSSSRASVLDELSLVMAGKGDYKSAYNYHVAFKSLNDSLFNKENQKKITRAEMQYKFDKESQSAKIAQNHRELVYSIIAIVLILGIIIAIIMYRLQESKAKIQQLAKESAELSNKDLSLREDNLKRELEFKNKELTTNIMYLLKKNEFNSEISSRLMELKKQMKRTDQDIIQKIIVDIKNAQDDDIWKEFEVRFSQVYNDFYERLNTKYPDLTLNEKRICAFLRLNMTTKEICALTRQSYNSLNVARARLRKKLNIQNEDINLVTFLENI
ncbi:tetratricopeptide repeat protein [Flavobacterium sp. LC2016-12]|uniref:tetratricopeptide repeat protein n=1 Tax=Flavobacterium sp. LC2016-12 TaxID=2783794 RepID=UPI001889E14A|nr:tetratricopeptide repeat protein [Flavobacterium sp. LC2016-12]MBF4466295.1 tetratricopeptide repeat protein [Flavobacterium sp. LC2016-12]